MNKKTALIVSWWGMWASYWAWAVLALKNEHNLTDFDIVITWSWSAGTMSYYLAEQYESIENIWTNLLSTKQFLNRMRRSKIIDIDYLIDEVFKKQDPLDVAKIHTKNTDYYITATHANTWRIEYLRNSPTSDLFEMMRATKAMPVFYGKKVLVDNEPYIDTPLSSWSNHKIHQAIVLGATHILVIDCGKRVSQYLVDLFLSTQWEIFRNRYKHEKIFSERPLLNSNIELLHISPQSKTSIWVLNNDPSLLRKTFDQWYTEVANNPEILSFVHS